MKRVIFHLDVNSAFLSWSAVKQVREGKPDLRLVPSVVSGDPSDRRSIVTAASMPAKRLGIKTAQPISMALRTCPGLVIVQGDWAWYKQCSEAFTAICRDYSPVLQKFSIDECFLDMTLQLGRRDPVTVATELKNRIRGELGFTVNVGIGSNKLLAKMASDFEKPDKVHTLWKEEIEAKMWPLGVRDLLWVGKRTEERLVAYGIGTIGDLARLQPASLARLVGTRAAAGLHDAANGIDDSPVETDIQEAKSYSAERTFAQDIATAKELDRALFNVACIVAHRIRRDNFKASCVSVFVKHSDFTVAQRQAQMARPTDVTALILNEARRLVATIWDGVTPLRQVGLGVSKLTHETDLQLSLFEDPNLEYYRQWDREFDERMAREKDARASAFQRPAATKKAGKAPEPDILTFRYDTGEAALAAVKQAVREHRTYTFARRTFPDGADGFELYDGTRPVERHLVRKN